MYVVLTRNSTPTLVADSRCRQNLEYGRARLPHTSLAHLTSLVGTLASSLGVPGIWRDKILAVALELSLADCTEQTWSEKTNRSVSVCITFIFERPVKEA